MTAGTGRTLRIGLTGGIASGKSIVADSFAELGVPVVDTDLIARELVAPDSPAMQEIRHAFGEAVVAEDGSLERRAMRRIVFSNTSKRARLEAILHPKIRRETERQVAAIKAPYLIVVVPLLVDSPMQQKMDRILVVDCSEATQIQRLMARDIETEEQARRIMATQSTRGQRLAIADDVIENDGTVEDMRKQVLAMHRS
jgi:dephospho-CoA kinase